MRVAKDDRSKRCIGFPEGTCNVILDADFIEGYSKKQSGPARVKEEKGWGVKVEKWSDETDEDYSERKEKEKGNKETDMRETEIWFRKEVMCPGCKEKRGQSIRRTKKRRLQQRQDDHELDVLKILMSELTLKDSGESQDDHYSFQN